MSHDAVLRTSTYLLWPTKQMNVWRCISSSHSLTVFSVIFVALAAYWLAQLCIVYKLQSFWRKNDSLKITVKRNSKNSALATFDPPGTHLSRYEGDNNDEIEPGWLVVSGPRDQEAADTRQEALSTLHLALAFQESGKDDKAKRLFKHAVALQPNHADILTHYGLFMEHVKEDLVRAEHLYSIALSHAPAHQLALQSRARTRPLVEEIDARLLRSIDQKRDFFLHEVGDSPALKRVKRENYFRHVHHTVAIEGNSLNLIQTRSILESGLAVSGKSLAEQNEILGMDAALRFLDQHLLLKLGQLEERDILDLHLRVLGFVDPVQAGHYRRNQVYVGSFTPVPPDAIQAEMRDFVEYINNAVSPSQELDTFLLHPVKLAAIVHYKFVYIHPFIDGNGRVGRLLMNLVLMQGGFPPVIIRLEDRLEYYETLKYANEGDLRPFIRLIANCTDRTLEEYLSETLEAPILGATKYIRELESM